MDKENLNNIGLSIEDKTLLQDNSFDDTKRILLKILETLREIRDK